MVVVLISIIMSVIVGSFTGVDREYEFRGFVQRLATQIEMARDKAVQTNHEWGLYVSREGIEFAEFDPINEEWLKKTLRPFKMDELDGEVIFRAAVENYPGQVDTDDEDLPTIMLFSSGETTPFEIEIEPEWSERRWVLSSDGFSRITAEREGDS